MDKIFLPTLVLTWVLLVSLGTTIFGSFKKTKFEEYYDFILLLVILFMKIVMLMLGLVFTYMKYRKHKKIMKKKW